MAYKICVLPGDGIGPEIIESALRVLEVLKEDLGPVEWTYGAIGGAALDKEGTPLPEATLARAKASDGVLLGAVGGPKWDNEPADKRPEQGLLALRKGLGVYANVRPCTIYPGLEDYSPLKPDFIRGTDLVIVRELVSGIYFGRREAGEDERGCYASDEESYYDDEIRRVAERAFQLARLRRNKVTLVDKANVLLSSKRWRKITGDVAKHYPEVALETLYVDNAAMQLIRRPADFDVILTSNLFGDILSDEMSQISGSIGLLPSASFGDGVGLYEPIHGSAPDIAGEGRANPLGTILSLALLLRHSLDREDLAGRIEGAVEKILKEGIRPLDLDPEEGLGTEAITDAVIRAL